MMNPLAQTTFAKLRGAWQRTLSNRRALAVLAECPSSERHRIAQDLGLSDSELQSLSCSHNGPSELMPERLEQLGLDPEFIKRSDPVIYRDLQRVCACCKEPKRCARDLAKGDVQVGMRSYCLNTSTIDALIVDRSDGH